MRDSWWWVPAVLVIPFSDTVLLIVALLQGPHYGWAGVTVCVALILFLTVGVPLLLPVREVKAPSTAK
jgi:hypothetical protein